MTSYPSKPTIGGDVGTWGAKINAIFDALFADDATDEALVASLVKEIKDARGNYPSLAARLAAGVPGDGGGSTDPGTTTPSGIPNTYIGGGNTYVQPFNHY